jgi:hypothetical protein
MISAVEAVGNDVKEESTEAMISCKITGLTAKATVAWLDTKGGADLSGTEFIISQGNYDNGAQTPTLKVKATSVTGDKNYYCKVTSGSIATSDPSETSVPLNVYGEIQESVLQD